MLTPSSNRMPSSPPVFHKQHTSWGNSPKNIQLTSLVPCTRCQERKPKYSKAPIQVFRTIVLHWNLFQFPLKPLHMPSPTPQSDHYEASQPQLIHKYFHVTSRNKPGSSQEICSGNVFQWHVSIPLTKYSPREKVLKGPHTHFFEGKISSVPLSA